MPVSPKFWATLNTGWPQRVMIPSDAAAITGVKRLYRHITGCPWPGKVEVVRGRHRRTWARGGVLSVAPEGEGPTGRRGWPAIVHDLSHLVHRRMNRRAKPHDSGQARIERRMQEYVLENLL